MNLIKKWRRPHNNETKYMVLDWIVDLKKKKRLIKDSVYMIGDIFGIRVLY